MARRMKSKIQPSVLKINFRLDDTSGGTVPQGTTQTYYIDLSQCASIVNRRFYRQGLNWAVAGFKFDTPVTSSLVVQKLPNTWVMSNAWEKGFRAWQKMIKHAVDETDQQSVKGKFLDFKIHADKYHKELGFDKNLLPVTYDIFGGNNPVTTVTEVKPGEWIPATLEVPVTREITQLPQIMGETAEYEIMAVGANYPLDSKGNQLNVVSLINGYANSRALPSISDPNTPDDIDDAAGVTPENWLAAMFNDGVAQDSGVIEDIVAYDQPPYPYQNDGTSTKTMYPGGEEQMSSLETHSLVSVTATTVGGMTRFEGGNFPCGLIAVHFHPEGNSAIAGLEVTLVPGEHRGYLCESMTEM